MKGVVSAAMAGIFPFATTCRPALGPTLMGVVGRFKHKATDT
jgi:hypothetical protein